MTNQQTCNQRIDQELTRTEDWLTNQYHLIDAANEAGDDEREDELREQIEPYMELTLSGGGPSSWLEVTLDRGQRGFEATSVVYHFANWFDHAQREVTKHEAPGIWRLAEYYAESAE